MPPLPFGVSEMYKLAKELGALRAVRRTLVFDKDPAQAELADVIALLEGVFKVVLDEVDRYLNLWIDSEESARAAQAVLLELERGGSRLRIGEAQLHCHRIGKIYDENLSPWFRRVLRSDEYERLDALFDKLRDYDGALLYSGGTIADWLMDEAARTNRILRSRASNRMERANDRVSLAYRRTARARDAFRDALIALNDLQNGLRA